MVNFVKTTDKSTFEEQKSNISSDAITFIEDDRQIHAQDTYYSCVPSGGESGQYLVWESDGKATWGYQKDTLWYGVDYDTSSTDPALTRIGYMPYHQSLPIQSQIKSCIAQGGDVIYWLDPTDGRWVESDPTYITATSLTVDEDNTFSMVTSAEYDITSVNRYEGMYIRSGNTILQCKIGYESAEDSGILALTGKIIETSDDDIESLTEWELGACKNGYDGTVRVFIPEFYITAENEGTVWHVKISESNLGDEWYHQEALLVDAYRSTVLWEVPENWGYLSTLPANSAISVINTNTFCRGGNNNATYDEYLESDPYKCLLGKPATYITRANMRVYARNAGSEVLNYDQYKNIFYWLYVIEYANLNSQDTFNSELTSEGYHQGGMGNGVTTGNYNYWTYYNGNNPVTPCGYLDELGDGTGTKDMVITMPTSSDEDASTTTYTFKPFRWRGFDNTFGDIWTTIEGNYGCFNGDDGYRFYIMTDTNDYVDALPSEYDRYIDTVQGSGYVKVWKINEHADIYPGEYGGASTTGTCDYGYTTYDGSRLLVGGRLNHGAYAGLGCLSCDSAVSYRGASTGFRSVSPFGSVLSPLSVPHYSF